MKILTKIQVLCTDIDTGKQYKSHKWEYYQCDCPDCYSEHQHCVRCYKNK